MKLPALLPVVAGIVAVIVSLARRSTGLLMELSEGSPSVETLTWTAYGARLLAFVLVYGLLLGIAYRIGTRTDDPRTDGSAALATSAVATVGYLVGTAIVFWVYDAGRQWSATVAIAELGSGVGTGIQFAVVAFAGIALARRRA